MQSKSTVFIVAVVLPLFAFLSTRYFMAGAATEAIEQSQPVVVEPSPGVAPVQTDSLRFATVEDC